MNVLVKDKMHFVQMCTTRAALKLEIAGMQRSRGLPSAYILAKRNFGLTGNRQHVLEQLEVLIEREQEAQEEKYSNVHAIGTS
jgi:hypothetical protein